MTLSWQGPTQAKVGDTIMLTLNTQSAQGMNNLGLLVKFDPAVFKAVDAVEGDILRQNNMQSIFTKQVNQANGEVEISLAGHGRGVANGDGSVCTLTFEVTGEAAQSQITLNRIAPTRAGGRELAYSTPAPYVVTVTK